MSSALADEVLVHLATPDRRGAAAHSAGLIQGGLALQVFVDEGLAPAMRQVGSLWESAIWTVADEHLATAAAEAALSSASQQQPVTHQRGEVVVACVEGDWHSLPPRMVAEVLLSQGWSVRFLGASQPTRLLVEHVTRHRPQVVLLSCAVPMALPELVTAVTALHAVDLPVHVGGRALSAHRAAAVGADGYATSAAVAVALLDAPLTACGRSAAAERLAAYRAVQALFDSWVAEAMEVLSGLMPEVADLSADVRARTAADLLHLLDCAGIGLLLDDPLLLDEQCDWLTHILSARAVSAQALPHGLAALSLSQPAGVHAGTLKRVLQEQHVRLTCARGGS